MESLANMEHHSFRTGLKVWAAYQLRVVLNVGTGTFVSGTTATMVFGDNSKNYPMIWLLSHSVQDMAGHRSAHFSLVSKAV